MRLLIIGGVAGGATAAARLRRLDEQAEIVIFERSGYVSYANCGMPYYIGGEIQNEKLLTLQTPESFKARFNIDVRVKNEVTSIDPACKTLAVKSLDTGKEYTESYDRLILCPGAKPVIPPLPGIENEKIFTLRSLEDTFTINRFVTEQAPKTAVVVGGGFIGLEMAENLRLRGMEVTIVERLPQVMPPLDYDMCCEVHSYIRSQGVSLVLGSSVTGFEESAAGGLLVSIEGRDPLPADMVILSIGVSPETSLAKACGMELGARGAIITDQHMRTSLPDIYAAGDAVLVRHHVSGQQASIALAGPANKQGRIIADNICGIPSVFSGALGSSVLKLFDMTVASTGLNEKTLAASGAKYDKVVTFSPSHATYYPGAKNMAIKTLFDPDTGKILGAQIVGFDGVDKRIDVMATAIYGGMTAEDLTQLDLAYAPPFSSAKDPVNMAGFTIENLRQGLVSQVHWTDIPAIQQDEGAVILDVRNPPEFEKGHIEGAQFIPLPELRARLGKLDKSKRYYICCQTAVRSYIACRMLSQLGYRCFNISGGYRFYETIVKAQEFDGGLYGECGLRL